MSCDFPRLARLYLALSETAGSDEAAGRGIGSTAEENVERDNLITAAASPRSLLLRSSAHRGSESDPPVRRGSR